MYEHLILDIEGTITTDYGETGKGYKELSAKLAELESSDITVILCSGRDIKYMKQLKGEWNLKQRSPLIGENGCVIFDGDSKELTFDKWKFSATKIMESLFEKNILVYAELDPAKEHMVTLYPKGYSYGLEYNQDQIMEIYKIVSETLADFDQTITYSSASVDIMPQGVNKLHGLKALLDKIPILDLKKTIYVGDSRNDLEIGKYVHESGGKFSVPSNALDELKENADFVASGEFDLGVLEVIEKFKIK